MSANKFSDITQQRGFMRLWFARIVGTAGNQMLMVALGWHMYDLTSSAWDLGLVGLYQFLPALLLMLLAGHAADRLHRGRIIVACLLTQGVVALTLFLGSLGIGAAAPWVSRELILLLSVLLGLTRAFQMPAQQALTPMLLPTHLLARGMAFSFGGMQAAIIIGPALGGLIYMFGASAVYGSCMACFALGCWLVLRLNLPHVQREAQAASLAVLLAGVRFAWRSKLILGAMSLDLFAVLLGGATALLPMFAKDILHVGPWGLGLLRAAPALGAVLTSVLLTRWPLRQRVGRSLFASVALFGLCMLVFGLSTSFLLSLLALAISGAADTVSVVVRQTLVQMETPDEMRGRVSAVNSIFIGASNQLGEFESGATAEWLGPVGSVVLGGVGSVLVALLWMRMFPMLAQRDRLERG